MNSILTFNRGLLRRGMPALLGSSGGLGYLDTLWAATFGEAARRAGALSAIALGEAAIAFLNDVGSSCMVVIPSRMGQLSARLGTNATIEYNRPISRYSSSAMRVKHPRSMSRTT